MALLGNCQSTGFINRHRFICICKSGHDKHGRSNYCWCFHSDSQTSIVRTRFQLAKHRLTAALHQRVLSKCHHGLCHNKTSILSVQRTSKDYRLFVQPCLLDLLTSIGFLILIGLSVNDGLLLIDAWQNSTDKYTDTAQRLRLALQQRFEPVMVITITTFAELLPLLIPFEESAVLLTFS